MGDAGANAKPLAMLQRGRNPGRDAHLLEALTCDCCVKLYKVVFHHAYVHTLTLH